MHSRAKSWEVWGLTGKRIEHSRRRPGELMPPYLIPPYLILMYLHALTPTRHIRLSSSTCAVAFVSSRAHARWLETSFTTDLILLLENTSKRPHSPVREHFLVSQVREHFLISPVREHFLISQGAGPLHILRPVCMCVFVSLIYTFDMHIRRPICETKCTNRFNLERKQEEFEGV